MAIQSIAVSVRWRIFVQSHALQRIPTLVSQPQSVCRCHRSRLFSSSTRLYRQQPNYKDSFGKRLRKALSETKIKWYPIPVGLGIGFLGLAQLYRVNEREKARREEEWENNGNRGDGESELIPKKRQRIRPTGPWFVSECDV
jgi:phosphatidylserine decarboxylase